MRLKLNRLLSKATKILLIGAIIFSTLSFGGIVVKAETNDYEKRIIELKTKYKDENIEFIDGAILYIGEELNIQDYIAGETEGEIKEIIKDEKELFSLNGYKLKAEKEGTSFLIIRTEEKTFAIEVAIIGGKAEAATTKNTVVDRNYYKVFIDPGHGGYDPGAVGNGVEEADINLKIAKKVKEKLKKENIDVKMSRESDSTVDLLTRPKMANSYGADIFLSIHQNSFSSSRAYGIESYNHRDKPQFLPYSNKLQSEMIKNTSAYNRGVKTANFAVIRESNMISSLIECGFVSNYSEAKKLEQDYYQEKLATAIAEATERQLKETITLKPEKGVFTDTYNHWAKEPIKDFVLKDYVKGYEDGTFKPDKAITRAEFVKIVNKAFGFKSMAAETFEDVNPSDWWYSEVRKAIKAGYISTENKKFRPSDNITREEVAAILTTINKTKDKNLDKLNKYNDKHLVANWAKTSVEGTIEEGYMGVNSNVFNPKKSITRAEAITSISRATK